MFVAGLPPDSQRARAAQTSLPVTVADEVDEDDAAEDDEAAVVSFVPILTICLTGSVRFSDTTWLTIS